MDARETSAPIDREPRPAKTGGFSTARRALAVALVSAAALVAGAAPASAAPGALDHTFNGTGKVLTNLPGLDEEPSSLAIQADGAILVAGYATVGGHSQLAVIRYRRNGSMDPSFGHGGVVETRVGPGSGINAIAIDHAGRIVAAGASFAHGRARIAIVRYRPSGSLDTSFGTDGRVVTPVASGARAFGVAIRPDGRIVVTGSAKVGGRENMLVARYRPDGSIDPSFGNHGIALVRIGPGSVANAVVLQPNGRIVVAGRSGTLGLSATDGRFALARFLPGGTLDPAFGDHGTLTTALTDQGSYAAALALEPDGRIVAAGPSASNTAGSPHFAVARYRPNGTLDPTFSGDGKMVDPIRSENGAFGVAIQSNGRIVVVGDAFISGSQPFVVARYLPAGAIDPSFGDHGHALTRPGGTATAVAIQADGRIVMVGLGGDGGSEFAVNRYLA